MSAVLDRVNEPADLKSLSIDELNELAAEIRSLIIETVSKTGGHLAANLGVVELTIALLKVFNPPSDKIVWDVSHQTYTYKILTGRKNRFNTLRQFDGISGFLRREESEYDAFGAGHSGTALSAALGMAYARDRRGSNEHVVVVLGDGSTGCGISFEAFNNVATTTRRLVVVLNDNEMSIAANVGSISRYLGGLLVNPRYNRWKRSVESFATRLKTGWLRSMYYRIEEAVKSLFLRSVLFEEFGLRYIGPIDGHNTRALLDALSIAIDSNMPIILHVSTQKGKGYSFAEKQPEKWHGTSGFDIASGEPLDKAESASYSDVFGATLERLASQDSRIIAITAAMRAGTGLSLFAERFPDRFFDVGISEEHAVVFAAGLATEGLLPVFAVYSTFSQRAVDCIIHDVCLQDLPVILCLDRAGIVGDDGPTHHGVFDIALLRPVPRLVIMQPKDEAELANMLFTATRINRPVVIRYPRGSGPGVPVPDEFQEIEIGKAEVIRGVSFDNVECGMRNAECGIARKEKSETPQSGTSPKLVAPRRDPKSEIVWLWALGDMIPVALKTAGLLEKQGLTAGVVNARFVRPLDEELLSDQCSGVCVIVTLENGVVTGGFGSAVEEFLTSRGFAGRVLRFGWPDQFIPQGRPDVLMEQFGLTAEAIARAIASVSNLTGVLPKPFAPSSLRSPAQPDGVG